MFEQARALEAAGRFDEAFAAFHAANDICRQALRSGADQIIQLRLGIEELKRRFTLSFMQACPSGDTRRRPIFIVGLPRSGSTLIEQILATHPDVVGMGECDAFAHAGAAYFPANPTGPTDPRAVARAYLDEIASLGWDKRRRFTDKTLSNFLRIGLIHMAFPNAVILHAVRDPIDTCWACYRGFFGSPNVGFAFDLAELGRHYVAYRGLMEHWTGVLPGRIIPVSYEALVGDLDAQVRRLLEICGLPWHEACLRFYENPRRVDTMSRDEVRLPIYANAIGRWRPYRDHLGPLFRALGRYAPPAT